MYIIIMYYCSAMYIIKYAQQWVFEKKHSNTFCLHGRETSNPLSFRSYHLAPGFSEGDP